MKQAMLTCLIAALIVSAARAAEPGLVLHYAFDEGQGAIAKDSSGHDNHGAIKGGAEFIKHGDGYALKFDGKDDFIDGGTAPGLAIEKGGTVELWFRPEACQGGLVAWTPSGGWPDMRFVAAFMTYRSTGEHAENGPLLLVTANGALHDFHPSDQPEKGKWQHYAITFGDDAFTLYKNGIRHRVSPLGARPNLKDVPLWIGKSLGLGRLHFKGLMDDVRLYSRPLAPAEIATHYRQRAREMGRDTTPFRQPSLSLQPVPEPGWILAVAGYGLMQPLTEGCTLRVSLHRPGARKALAARSATLDPLAQKARLTLDVARVRPSDYEVRAAITDARGAPIGRPAVAPVTWPGQPAAFKNVKVLNNLVWELLNEKPGRVRRRKTYPFINPTDRWVHVAATATGPLRLSLDTSPETRDIITFTKAAAAAEENMRSYTDEEIARWGPKLFRHYGIEGNTQPVTADPYILPHLDNGDFARAAEGWKLEPAETNSIGFGQKLGFGYHQGRYPRTDQGDSVLIMTRSAGRPNRVTQRVRDLQPGRLYSLRMYTGDFQDMSKEEKHAFTIKLENVDLLPDQCFTHIFRNYPGRRIPGQTREDAQWMNYHWRIFRAKGTTARLTLSDWTSEKEAGGPTGRQLILNFIQIQPYYPQDPK